ncbi:hypothetical protein PAXRUDRAFT_640921 [Paxillus rubicundulus Ve08.2h10]|uniref:Uncharacterized protein n=1 Tax=Paxillus rubicundulus Ve08.2h10 TaxID=930991 RepID=A0A0D0DVF0_9AGAM|nr:hypothetical protein PAXRUDRAFT_640921 [Paxillus rubicundulus Ve08.2h10]
MGMMSEGKRLEERDFSSQRIQPRQVVTACPKSRKRDSDLGHIMKPIHPAPLEYDPASEQRAWLQVNAVHSYTGGSPKSDLVLQHRNLNLNWPTATDLV